MTNKPLKYAEDTGTDGNSVANEMNNVEVELQAELASLRNPTGQGKQFRRLDYGSDMMIFLQTIPGDEDPFQLITRLFKGLKDSGTGRSFRYLQRLTPVQRTCYANMNDIQSTVDELLQTHLPWILQNRVGTDEGQFTFQILYRHRNNDQLDRESLVKAVSAKLYGVFPNCKADLKQPDIVVLLEVCKSVCCCAVVSDFYRLQKFNLNAAFPKT